MENYRQYAPIHTNFPSKDILNATPDRSNLLKILETLCATDDVETHVKIFTVLAVYLTSNNNCNDDIVSCKLMYDKIYNVLNNGLPLKIARTLNFVSVLLYIDEEAASLRAKSVVAHARNILRLSGCLLQMCTMFTSLMLHQETWRALCRCLAECCRNSSENQSYCSHLVPLSVTRCAQGSIDAMLPLKTLIDKHTRNLGLFLESNGTSIFNRELLQNDTCMQLLNTLVENADTETLTMLPERLFQSLHYFKKVYGSHTKVGQWAVVVLHNLNSRLKITKGLYDEKKMTHQNNTKTNNETCNTCVDIKQPNYDETTNLLQNVIREIQLFNANNKINQTLTKDKVTNVLPKSLNKVPETRFRNHLINSKHYRNERKRIETCSDMSFTFLRAQNSRNSSMNITYVTKKPEKLQNMNKIHDEGHTCNLRQELSKCHFTQQDVHIDNDSKLNHSFKIKSSVYDNISEDFRPIFVSTPKHLRDKISKTANLSKQSQLSRYSRKQFKKYGKMKDKVQKGVEISNQSVSVMHRSISSRLFDAINGSCTTFVKTVRNIFKTAKSKRDMKNENNESKLEASCSYSFTEYMRNRDAALAHEYTVNKSAESDVKKSCNTCNNTTILRQKVIDDDHLRETVRKLKLGINLYGCDFKKIAKAMWPRETYMTPTVLYNLYRKLIIK